VVGGARGEEIVQPNEPLGTPLAWSRSTSPIHGEGYNAQTNAWDTPPRGQRRQWLDDVTDWAKTELPRVVHLAEYRGEYRMFVHGIVQAPHGV